MTTFVGDHNCKLDAKGRMMLPSAFVRQMAGAVPSKFVVKKDIFENCLIIYPDDEWERQVRMLKKKLNPYKKEHNKFQRNFFKGVAEVIPDANNRILIPKRLLDEIEADKEIVLAGQPGKIELWSKAQYENIDMDSDEFANMAEDLMDGLTEEFEE